MDNNSRDKLNVNKNSFNGYYSYPWTHRHWGWLEHPYFNYINRPSRYNIGGNSLLHMIQNLAMLIQQGEEEAGKEMDNIYDILEDFEDRISAIEFGFQSMNPDVVVSDNNYRIENIVAPFGYSEQGHGTVTVPPLPSLNLIEVENNDVDPDLENPVLQQLEEHRLERLNNNLELNQKVETPVIVKEIEPEEK